MERENFYILLRLSLNPPVEDQDKIDAAILKMQSNWSRYRNHPTKGIQAKKYIGLIPEIRKVMSQPDLRFQEAKAAVKILKKRAAAKYKELDRHLAIRMSKGYITDEEVFKLAKLHSIPESSVQKRILDKKQEKSSALDKNLSIRMSKGYITEAEILKLSKLYSIGVKDIRKRITCPITKENEQIESGVKEFDKTVEKIIKDNLKIIGHASLYDFLGVSSRTDLQSLQKLSKEKETALSRIAKKDANVTTSSILVGHCLAVFNDENRRKAYDSTLVKSHFATLDSDIDVAGMDGKIRAEYFDMLVKRAVEFEMDTEEAAEYIKNYCKKKKWDIETKKKKMPLKLILFVGLILIFLIGGFVFWKKNSQNVKKEYQTVLEKTNRSIQLDDKLKMFRTFLSQHGNSEYAEEIQAKIKEIEKIKVKKTYDKAVQEGESLIKKGQFEKARDLYSNYINQNSDKKYVSDIKQKLSKLDDLIDENDYKVLETYKNKDVIDRVKAYDNYVNKNPRGKYTTNVTQLIKKLSDEFFIAVMRQISVYEKNEDWGNSIQLCTSFINIYGDTPQSLKLKDLRDVLQTKLQDQLLLKNLISRAEAKGTDYVSAKQIYLDFLEAYPNSSLRQQINAEVKKINNNHRLLNISRERERIGLEIKDSKGRFVINKGKNIITDKTSGLMWSLIDSHLDSGTCMDYETAVDYVGKLNTGGYKDWRLPTIKEMSVIYKKKPYFPSNDIKWYWSSKTYTRYSDGWSKEIDTINSKKETTWKATKVDSRECGAVRAVRP